MPTSEFTITVEAIVSYQAKTTINVVANSRQEAEDKANEMLSDYKYELEWEPSTVSLIDYEEIKEIEEHEYEKEKHDDA